MNRFASLTSRLVITTVALVALVSLLIGAATTLAMRNYLTDQLDADVIAALQRAEHGPPQGTREPHFDQSPDDVRGQAVGTLTAFFIGTGGVGDVITEGSDGLADRKQLSTAALNLLEDVPADGDVHPVELPDVGGYRVATAETANGSVVTGLPSDDLDDVLASLIWWEILLALAAVVAAAGVGAIVVRRQLRPLHEVAATAHEVSALPLGSGTTEVAPRVPDRLTDEATEVGQVGAALNTLLSHVETSLTARHRSEQQVRQFVADASHELRTPLATIKGYAELSRRTPADAEALLAALGKVESEAGRMSSLVEDLLLLARLDAGRPLRQAPVDLTRLLLETVSDARVVGSDHHWKLELPDEAVGVTGDEQRLHQVVTNLLNNARRHTPPGTTVIVSVAPGDTVVLTVEDDGPGFPPDLVAPFDRFSRGDLSRTRADDPGGAGLGLSLVAAIVGAHGGAIEVMSKPGLTRFTLELPA